MLVHKFLSNNRGPLCSAKQLATTIVLCAFGQYPIKSPFIQIFNDGKEFFCFEFQFTIAFEEKEDCFEFRPNWHCYHDEALEKEKAIATLHNHLFIQQGPAVGY